MRFVFCLAEQQCSLFMRNFIELNARPYSVESRLHSSFTAALLSGCLPSPFLQTFTATHWPCKQAFTTTAQPAVHVSPHPLRALTPWNDRAAVDATAAVDVAQQTRFNRDRPRAPTGRRLAHESCCRRDAGLHLFSRATAHRNGWRHGARRDGTVPRCGTAAPTRQASSGPSTR